VRVGTPATVWVAVAEDMALPAVPVLVGVLIHTVVLGLGSVLVLVFVVAD